MPKLLASEIEASVKTLDSLYYSSRSIVTHLKQQGVTISQSAVCNIIKNKGLNRQAKLSGIQHKKKVNRPVRSRETVNRIKNVVKQQNPPSQRELASKFNCSLATINNIIHKDLELVTRHKTRVHRLDARQKGIRLSTSKRLLRGDLQEQKLEFAVTLDEAWLYLQECNTPSKICYVKANERVPDDWVNTQADTFGPKVMVVCIMTGRGVCPLLVVPPKVKINAQYYIDEVLRPLVEKFLPKLYPGELDKLFVHHDCAPSHTSRLTNEYMSGITESIGIRFTKRADTPIKGPDGSPLDFFGFGYLKGKMQKARVRTIEGLVKRAKREWQAVTVETIQKVFLSWRHRLKLIVQREGNHIENVKNIHRKALVKININRN